MPLIATFRSAAATSAAHEDAFAVAREAVLAALEFSFSYWLDPVEGTSTPLSSAVLQLAHAVALAGLWRAPPGRTFEGEKAS